jgi:peptidoglycan/LPS O-acetylase OafA/YrhL
MQTGSKILPLTSIRFFAAFYVVLFHTVPEVGHGYQLGRFLQLGYISVSFFFTLSGFILALVYLQGEMPLDKRRFWAARFARIFPLYVATLVLAVPPLLMEMIHRRGWAYAILRMSKLFLANCFMLQAWDIRLRGLDNPNWSVAVEVFFYLVFPLFALLLRRRSARALCFLALGFYLGGLLLVLWASGFHLPIDELKFLPILHIHEFVAGTCAGLWLLHLGPEGREALRKNANRILFASLVAFSVFFYFYPRIPFLLVHDGLLTPIFLAIILALFAGSGRIHRLLSHSSLVLVGEASFALYLLHIPVWIILKYFPHGHSLAAYPFYLVSIVLLSILSFKALEGPSRRYILGALATRPRETAVEAAVLQ